MGLELERVNLVETQGCNFSNFLNQTITHPHSVFSVFPLYLFLMVKEYF
jgi:hypothetical protein